MKKLLSILILILTLCSFVSCGCKHTWWKTSCTATCQQDGISTYECTKCKKQKTENISASTTYCDFEYVSGTSIGESGEYTKTYVCQLCKNEKTNTYYSLCYIEKVDMEYFTSTYIFFKAYLKNTKYSTQQRLEHKSVKTSVYPVLQLYDKNHKLVFTKNAGRYAYDPVPGWVPSSVVSLGFEKSRLPEWEYYTWSI